MKRIAGLAAALVVVAAACSDSPTAPGKNPLIDHPTEPNQKLALDRSQGNPTTPPTNHADGRQNVTTFPPFWVNTLGTDLGQGDDEADFVLIGFPFTFFGRQWTGTYVGSNGYLTFDAPFTQYVPTGFPTSPPHAIIAAAWEDWLPGGEEDLRAAQVSSLPGRASIVVNSGVFFQRLGVAPNRKFVATWLNLPVFGEGNTPQGTFQIQLLERLNVILMSYNGLTRSIGHWGLPIIAGISSGGFTGFGGFPGQLIVASGNTIPALNGKTVCLINLGGAYRVYQDLICSLFVF